MKSLNGQSLIDLAIQTAGSAAAAYELAVANGLSVTDDLTPGAELKSVDVFEQKVLTYFVNKNITPATDLSQIAPVTTGSSTIVDTMRASSQNVRKALVNQTWLDLAIQHLGSVDKAYELALANGVSLTDDTTPGTKLTGISDGWGSGNKTVFNYYSNKNLKPASALEKTATAVTVRIFDRTFGRTFN